MGSAAALPNPDCLALLTPSTVTPNPSKNVGGPSSMATSRAMSGISGNKCTFNQLYQGPPSVHLLHRRNFVCPSVFSGTWPTESCNLAAGRPNSVLLPSFANCHATICTSLGLSFSSIQLPTNELDSAKENVGS